MHYGDEIGMGDNVFLGDRNGVRTPMQWSPDRNAGYSRANPQRLILPVIIDPEYHYESLNVEAQQGNRTRSLVDQADDRAAQALPGLRPRDHRVPLAREPQGARLRPPARGPDGAGGSEPLPLHPVRGADLRQFKGRVPVELIGRTKFPQIGELPYLLTLGEHAFYWFSLDEPRTGAVDAKEASYQPPALDTGSSWEEGFTPAERAALESVLPGWLEGRRWLRAHGREISQVRILDVIPFDSIRVAVLDVEFSQGEPEQYVLPLALESGEKPAPPQAVIATVRRAGGSQAALVDALSDPAASAALLEAIRTGTRSKGRPGRSPERHAGLPQGEPRPYKQEHHAASVQYGDALLLKFYRAWAKA